MINEQIRKTVLGVPVDEVEFAQAWKILCQQTAKDFFGKVFQVVTIYSEFFVDAQKDSEFLQVLQKADLVVPDGVGVLAALEFQKKVSSGESFLKRLRVGLETGKKVLAGKIGETVTGVNLTREILQQAQKNEWKVFLLGGFGGVAEELAQKMKKDFPLVKIETFEGGQVSLAGKIFQDQEVVAKINEFAPDFLLVAFGPGKQEKWIFDHKSSLKAKVAIGVGGTFNELTGRVKSPPAFLTRFGLRSLGRLLVQPQRIGRMWKAWVVFPWMVFRG